LLVADRLGLRVADASASISCSSALVGVEGFSFRHYFSFDRSFPRQPLGLQSFITYPEGFLRFFVFRCRLLFTGRLTAYSGGQPAAWVGRDGVGDPRHFSRDELELCDLSLSPSIGPMAASSPRVSRSHRWRRISNDAKRLARACAAELDRMRENVCPPMALIPPGKQHRNES
jgi:hypothetical protein